VQTICLAVQSLHVNKLRLFRPVFSILCTDKSLLATF